MPLNKPNPTHLLVHDVGTTGNKACLYRVGQTLELVDSHVVEYPLYVLDNGGVEQNVDEWWAAIVKSTQQVFQATRVDPSSIRGMAFCAQMQGVVMVDEQGERLAQRDELYGWPGYRSDWPLPSHRIPPHRQYESRQAAAFCASDWRRRGQR